MADPSDDPFARVAGPWERVIEESEAAAEAHRDAGRTAVVLHPGDVATLTGDPRTAAERRDGVDLDARRLGFDVVVPGDEFDRLRTELADRSVEDYEVFRATANGMVFLRTEVAAGDLVVVLPAYYDLDDRAALERVARKYGLRTHVRPLSGETVVTIDHARPAPFFPE